MPPVPTSRCHATLVGELDAAPLGDEAPPFDPSAAQGAARRYRDKGIRPESVSQWARQRPVSVVKSRGVFCEAPVSGACGPQGTPAAHGEKKASTYTKAERDLRVAFGLRVAPACARSVSRCIERGVSPNVWGLGVLSGRRGARTGTSMPHRK